MRLIATVTTAAVLALSGAAFAGVDASVNIGISNPAPAVSVRVGTPPPPPPVVVIEKGDNGKHLGHYKKGKKKHGKKHKD